MQFFCEKVAQSSVFSGITTLLTIYALFGDDMRLLCTEKPEDWIFDCITIVGMSIFVLEIVVCCFGKAGYVFGFFFWLDIMATITLVFDVTTISEALFGDSISNMADQSSTDGAGAPGSDSADAARAARMSRVGSKAGRVVRLIRLVRLIRFVKLYKRSNESTPHVGVDWDDDDDHNVSESAVSKKLSEMTTRRVVMLVLVIMLSLPFFQPSMYVSEMPTSAQYSINHLFRFWHRGLRLYLPLVNETQRLLYLDSPERAEYVDDFFMCIFYHNRYCDSGQLPQQAVASPLDSFGKLLWVGTGGDRSSVYEGLTELFLPRLQGRSSVAPVDMNARWNGKHWLYYSCNLTSDPIGLLDVPFGEMESCLSGTVRGVSLIKKRESRVDCPETLRYQERSVSTPTMVTSEEWKSLFFMFVFDRRSGSRMEAYLNVAQTCWICFLLGFGAMTFSNDANRFVLSPIERMIAKIDKIRNNPLAALTIGDREQRREQVAAARSLQPQVELQMTAMLSESSARPAIRVSRTQRLTEQWLARLRACWASSTDSKAPEPMETVVLEKTIIKIGSLLALGFGEAGAEIIGQNMKGESSSTLNAMVPGRKVEATFGFCDIRNFMDTTEVLQDQVMVFVNQIAGVVHSCTQEFFGSPNKNIGNAFLLAWRLSGFPQEKQRRLADMALIALVKIIAQINKSPVLAEYKRHEKLLKRIPNYTVRMSFGLHSGWAIEGAIGSEFKIDASYLSPNVNMAARLEGVTKLYGCHILISESHRRLMSESIREECRLIDNVWMEGTRDPFKLFTLDLDDSALELAPPHRKNGGHYKFRQRIELQKRKTKRWSDDYDMHDFFAADPDMAKMRAKFTMDFFCRFHMAYLNYEAGEWAVAKSMLEVSRLALGSEDGPSVALLRYMQKQGGSVPKHWPGYRLLTERPLT